MESKIYNIPTTTQCDDLSNPHSDAKTEILNAIESMRDSLINELDSFSRKIRTAIVVAAVVSGLIQTVVIIAGLVIIDAALHP